MASPREVYGPGFNRRRKRSVARFSEQPLRFIAWRLCDGNRSAQQIAAEPSRQFSAPVQEGIVLLALRQLADAKLFVEPQQRVEPPSRRDHENRQSDSHRVARAVLPCCRKAVRQKLTVLFESLCRTLRLRRPVLRGTLAGKLTYWGRVVQSGMLRDRRRKIGVAKGR